MYFADSNRFILDPSNNNKVSEIDFAYQIWLPLLKKLFQINNDLVRIKVDEMVLSGSFCFIGFKVDVRILFDFKQEESDIVCGEACVSFPGQAKLEHDTLKLLREGKLVLDTLKNVLIGSNESISWMLPLSGPICSFYTTHNTKYSYYHVSTPQFTTTFLSSFIRLANFYLLLKTCRIQVLYSDNLDVIFYTKLYTNIIFLPFYISIDKCNNKV